MIYAIFFFINITLFMNKKKLNYTNIFFLLKPPSGEYSNNK